MPDLPLILTSPDYPRVMPLASGQIRPEGIDLTLLLSERGSWPGRAEMLRRALQDPDIHGGEQSMMIHLSRIDQRDRSHVGLPIFPLRNFTARDLYVRQGSGIAAAADLAGKRVGMYGWGNSGSVWYRHFLRYLGIDLATLQWCIGPVDSPMATTSNAILPPGVTAPTAGRSLAEMLIAGELDAVYSPPVPKDFHPLAGPIVRLFPDYKPMEQEYFRVTGAYPPQHLVLVRRAVWEQNKWIARSLTDAYIACEDQFTASMRGFPYSTPWQSAELAETEAVMGQDFHPYGYEKNRRQIEMFCDQAHEVGLTRRRVSPEEYFEEYLAS